MRTGARRGWAALLVALALVVAASAWSPPSLGISDTAGRALATLQSESSEGPALQAQPRLAGPLNDLRRLTPPALAVLVALLALFSLRSARRAGPLAEARWQIVAPGATTLSRAPPRAPLLR